MFRIALLMTLLTLLTSCSFKFEDKLSEDENQEEIADTILFKSEIHVVQDTNTYIKADVIEVYSKSSKQIFKQAEFKQFDDNNDATMSGTADNIILDSQNNDMEILGNIEILLVEDDTTIYGDYFRWHEDENRLDSKEEDIINISRGNGTRIQGRGLSIDTQQHILYFSGTSLGTIYTDDEARVSTEDALITEPILGEEALPATPIDSVEITPEIIPESDSFDETDEVPK